MNCSNTDWFTKLVVIVLCCYIGFLLGWGWPKAQRRREW